VNVFPDKEVSLMRYACHEDGYAAQDLHIIDAARTFRRRDRITLKVHAISGAVSRIWSRQR
jgi:hypothetical protein